MCWRGCRSALAPADELAKSPVCHLTRRLAPGSRVGTSRSVRRPEPCDSARAQDRDSRLAVETAENTVSQANVLVFPTNVNTNKLSQVGPPVRSEARGAGKEGVSQWN